MTHSVHAEVAIVGAGISGLVAARTLEAHGIDALVIEARGRVGGRTLNAELGDGKVVELGGQFVGPGQGAIVGLAGELGVSTFPTQDTGTHLLEFHGRVRRRRGEALPVGPLALAGLARAQARLNRLARTVPADAPWTATRAAELDGTTLAAWLASNVRSRAAREILEIGVRAVWSFDCADVSLLHVLACINAGDSFQTLLRTTGGAQQDRFIGGSQEIPLRLAAELRNPPLLNAPVQGITQSREGVTLHGENLTVVAQHAIVAVPPMLAARIDYRPAMPAGREQLLARTPQGTILKCLAIYDSPFWREAGMSGQAASDKGPVTSTFDNSPPDGSPGILLAFVAGGHARALLSLVEDERRQAVLACLARLYGPAAAKPERFLVGSWVEDPWTRGCYAGYMTPGAWTSFGRWLRMPHGRIHWAGSETATRWIGFMDGAVTAGERAARDAAAAIRLAGGISATRHAA